MTVERLQCPSCGAGISADGRASLFCSYCGARLRIKTGASGNPMAVLDEIKEDTSLTARRAALEHLQAEVAELERRRAEVGAEWEREKAGRWKGWSLVRWAVVVYLAVNGVALVLYLLGEHACGTVGLVLLLAAAFALVVNQSPAASKRKQAREQKSAALTAGAASLDEEIARARERVERLEAEVDDAIEGMGL